MSVENWEKLKAPFLEVAQNEEYVRDAAIRFSNKTETVVTTDYVREVMRAQADKFSTKETTSNAFIANLIDHDNIMVNSLVPRRWQIWEAPAEAEFVTSDNPVITFIPIGPNLWHPGYGFNTPNVVAAFPLAPTACLVVASDNMLGNPAALQIHEIGDQQHKIVDASTVSRINELVISCSDRFVYAKNCDANIEQAVNDIGHTTVPLVNAFLHPFPGARQIEEHLRKTIGIPRQADAA